MKRKILLDADTLLEFLINRKCFEGDVDVLGEVAAECRKNHIDLCISSRGLDSIKSYIAHWKDLETSEKIAKNLSSKFKIKVLKVFKYIVEAVRSSSIKDTDSAIETTLAKRKNIGAILTHQPENFCERDVNILSLTDFQERQKLELLLNKNTREIPAVLSISSADQILTLNKIYYQPSYSAKDIEQKDTSSIGRNTLTHAEVLRRLTANPLAGTNLGLSAFEKARKGLRASLLVPERSGTNR